MLTEKQRREIMFDTLHDVRVRIYEAMEELQGDLVLNDSEDHIEQLYAYEMGLVLQAVDNQGSPEFLDLGKFLIEIQTLLHGPRQYAELALRDRRAETEGPRVGLTNDELADKLGLRDCDEDLYEKIREGRKGLAEINNLERQFAQ